MMEQNSYAESVTTRDEVATLMNSSNETKPLIYGKWYDVDPKSINVELLMGHKETKQHEWMASHAYETLVSAYIAQEEGKRFEVLVPKIDNGKWESMSLEQLLKIPEKLGGEIATESQLELLWGQMITNGQRWEELLTGNYYVIRSDMQMIHTAKYLFASSNICGRKSVYNNYYEGCPFMGVYSLNSDEDLTWLISTPVVVRYK